MGQILVLVDEIKFGPVVILLPLRSRGPADGPIAGSLIRGTPCSRQEGRSNAAYAATNEFKDPETQDQLVEMVGHFVLQERSIIYNVLTNRNNCEQFGADLMSIT